MKKILVIVMAIAAVSFAACTGETKGGDATDSTAVEATQTEEITEEDFQALADGVEAQDADALKTAIESIQAKIQALIEAGDTEAAKKYIDAIKSFVEDNKAKIETLSPELATTAESTVAGLVSKVVDLPGNVAAEAEGAANEVVEAGKAQLEETKAAAVEKANEQVEAGKAKVNEQVEAGKAKANQAIDNAANDLKKSIGL